MLFDFVFVVRPSPEGVCSFSLSHYSKYLFPKCNVLRWLAHFFLLLLLLRLVVRRERRNMKRERVHYRCATNNRKKRYNYGGCMTQIHRHRRSSVSFKKTGCESTTEHFVIGKRSERTCLRFSAAANYNRIF